jgi:hypothetical protein
MQLKARKVRMIGIAYKDAPPKTQGFLSRLGDPFSQRLVDRDGRAGIEFGVTGVPETYLIGKDGQVLAKHTGPLSLKTPPGSQTRRVNPALRAQGVDGPLTIAELALTPIRPGMPPAQPAPTAGADAARLAAQKAFFQQAMGRPAAAAAPPPAAARRPSRRCVRSSSSPRPTPRRQRRSCGQDRCSTSGFRASSHPVALTYSFK